MSKAGSLKTGRRVSFINKGKKRYGELVKESETHDGCWIVRTDDERKFAVPETKLHRVKHEDIEKDLDEEEDEEDDSVGINGFAQYRVNWDPEHINFGFPVGDLQFNGFWRKRGPMSYAVDIYAKGRDGTGGVAVATLGYDNDPRENIRSLNSDICAAANKFLHEREVNGLTLDTLRKRADRPMISVRRLGTVDKLILKLKEFRDTAIRAGGTRFFEFEGDKPNEPKVTIQVNLTEQAMGLKGKVPSLRKGVVFDQAIRTKRGERVNTKQLQMTATSSNVEALAAKLIEARDRGDIVEARKIRVALRKMGHTGGTRSLNGQHNKGRRARK